MVEGFGYTIPISNLSTGTSNSAYLLELRAGSSHPIFITSINGHFRNGDSGQNVSFAFFRASAATAGSAITVEKRNASNPAASFSASTSPTSVTPTGGILAPFGGNGGSNWSWYPSVEQQQIYVPVSTIMVLQIIIAPSSALTMQGEIAITAMG